MPDSSRRRPSTGTGRPGARGAARPTPRTGTRAPRGTDRPRSTTGRARPPAPRTSAEGGVVVAPPRRRFTGRMAVVAVVLAVLTVSYASSMRAYLQQRSHIADLRSQIASSSGEIDRLEREKDRWNDDAYVADQARERFGWVLAGETAYQVIGRDGKPLSSDDRLTDPDQVVKTAPKAWWSDQYDSLRAADHPPKKRTKAPASSIPADAR